MLCGICGREGLTVRRIEQNQFFWRVSLERFNAALEVGHMNLQLVTVGVEKVERIAFAAILLPLLCSDSHEALTKRMKIGHGDGECNVIVGRIRGAAGDIGFERKAHPEVACTEIRAFIPACYGKQTKDFVIEAKCPIQIGYRQGYVIQPGDHFQRLTPPGAWLAHGVERDQHGEEEQSKDDDQQDPPAIKPGFRLVRRAHRSVLLLGLPFYAED